MLLHTCLVVIYGVYLGFFICFLPVCFVHSHNVGSVVIYIGYDLLSVSYAYSPAYSLSYHTMFSKPVYCDFCVAVL